MGVAGDVKELLKQDPNLFKHHTLDSIAKFCDPPCSRERIRQVAEQLGISERRGKISSVPPSLKRENKLEKSRARAHARWERISSDPKLLVEHREKQRQWRKQRRAIGSSSKIIETVP